jgi:hypothetical protein
MPVTYEVYEAERLDIRHQASHQVNYRRYSYDNGVDDEPVVQLR